MRMVAANVLCALAPGAAAWTIVLAWSLLGDSLNDVLNPRTR